MKAARRVCYERESETLRKHPRRTVGDVADRALDRGALLADLDVRGRAWCASHAAAVDAFLREVFEAAASPDVRAGVALVAVGGYGRGDLCPHSDIDVMLVHRGVGGGAVAEIADRIWYPLWDTGMHVGHSVTTVDQALSLARDDVDTATTLLSARLVAGDASVVDELSTGAVAQWRARARRTCTQLGLRVGERHASSAASDVAFALEPDLKDGRGGLRDIQSLWWADVAVPFLSDDDRVVLGAAYDALLDVRVELHRRTGRSGNVLVLEDRDAVAASLGVDSDALMYRIAEVGRVVAWHSDDGWRRVALMTRGPLGRRRTGRSRRVLGDGIELRDGEVHVTVDAASAPHAILTVALAAARAHAVLSRSALDELGRCATAVAVDGWTDDARDALVALLSCGRHAVPVIEALDHVGLWSESVLPEWTGVRARPQHNPFHRYTVDRHLLETVACAARLAPSTDRPDLLVLAALLHDLGKRAASAGDADDHVEAGAALARAIGARIGLAEADVDLLVSLVANHLLLVELATRRDVDDPATLQRVLDVVPDRGALRLLAALTEADARATGPAAWTPWRAELVSMLVERVDHLLANGSPPVAAADLLADPVVVGRLEGSPGGRHIEADADTITVVTPDRPGVFSRIAGALALHGLEVLTADAVSTDAGAAVSRFRVVDPLRGSPPWDRVVRDVERALDGRLALSARLADRARQYRRKPIPTPRAAEPVVRFDDRASRDATVVDVHTADAAGVLYGITRALAELDLDIRSAKIQTIGHEVVDAFYLVDRHGRPIDDEATRAEVVAAIRHALTSR